MPVTWKTDEGQKYCINWLTRKGYSCFAHLLQYNLLNDSEEITYEEIAVFTSLLQQHATNYDLYIQGYHIHS